MKARIAGARTWLQANPNLPEALAAFAIKLAGAALSFGFSFLIARTLGAAGTGGYALALTTALFGATFALFGLDYVLLRSMAGNVREGKTAEARGAARSTMLATLGFAAAVGLFLILVGNPLLNHLLGVGLDPRLIVIAGIAVIPLTFNRVAITAMRGSGAVVAAQWFEGPQAMLVAVLVLLGLILAQAPVDTRAVTTMFFAVTALSAVAAGLYYARRIRHWPAPVPQAIRPLLGQGWQISFIVLSRMVLDWIVLVSLSASFSVAEVGQFRTAWQMTSLIALIVATFDVVAGPRIAAAHRVGELDTIRRIMRQSVAAMVVLSAPLFIVMLGFPEWLLGLFGPEFPVAAPALRILALGQLVNILSGPLGSVLIMTGAERGAARVSLAALVLLGIFCVTLIPAYGLVGAALTTSLTILFRTGTQYVMVRRVLAERA